MKFVVYVMIVVLAFSQICLCEQSHEKATFESMMKTHLQMMNQIKSESRKFLHSIYSVSNDISEIREEAIHQDRELELNRRLSEYDGTHSSEPLEKRKKKVSSVQYDHRDFKNITVTLKELAKKHPKYMILTTAQKEFNLPNPGGICSKDKNIKKPCKHYIVYLTNHKISNKNKQQIYISGSVHGDERVGPTATIELIKLLLENKKNPYIKNLLDKRYIVITPMTNPYGYFKNVREELLIKDEDITNINFSNYEKYHKDINRDFPYLVDNDKCMETIGARVVNELFLKHIFSLSLSFHGGTESFTYPFGTPNHIQQNDKVIPIKYINKRNRTVPNPTKKAFEMAKLYRMGKYDGVSGKSTNSPDHNAMSEIALSSAGYKNNKNYFSYPVGDMSSVVYPVRGGMEDWAYSGSWEGYPIITQPCKPHTYNGYKPEKTLYDKYFKVALKSIMFLLEISHNKFPEQMALGRKNNNCLINLKRNAFFNKKAKAKVCLDPINDGYIPRILRLSMALIDLMEPYLNLHHKMVKEGDFTYNFYLKWGVGGAINVDETFVLFDFVDDVEELREKVLKTKKNSQLINLFRYKSKKLSGHGVWNNSFNESSYFKYHSKFKTQKNHFVFMVLARADSNWGVNSNPDPPVKPQTHIANLRNNDNYVVKNGNFKLKGNIYQASELKVINLNK